MNTTQQACDHILIAEANITGHRLMYVAVLAEVALSDSTKVTITLPEGAEDSPEFTTHLAHLRQRFTLVSHNKAAFKELVTLSDQLGCSRLVIPDADRFLPEIFRNVTRLRHSHVALLVMRPPSTMRDSRRIKRRAKSLLISVCRLISNVEVYELASSLTNAPGPHQVVDPIRLNMSASSVENFRSVTGISKSRYWFGIFGAINERKNPLLVMSALIGANIEGTGIIIAGQISEALQQSITDAAVTLRTRGIPVVIINRSLSSTELDSGISAVDCVVLAHSNEGPSGIMGKAAAAGTRVICAGARSLRTDAQSIYPNAHWSILRLPELSNSLIAARALPAPQPMSTLGDKDFTTKLLGRLAKSDEPKGIVQVLLSPRVGGAESVASDLETEWRRRGTDVTTIYLDPDKESPTNPISRAIRLRRGIREKNAEVIVAHSALPSAYARIVKPMKTTTISVLHSATDDFADRKLNIAERVLSRRTDHVVAVSEEQAERYVGHFGASVPVTIVQNGIRAGIICHPNCTTEPTSIVTISRIAEQKNPALWLQVTRSFEKDQTRIEFLWFGPSDGNPETEKIVQSAQTITNASFMGPTEDPIGVLHGSDIFFHTANREAHSISILEAAAAGIPIVCSENSVFGWDSLLPAATFPSGNAKAAEEALKHVIANYATFRERAMSLSKQVHDRYEIKQVVDRYNEVIKHGK